MILSGAILPTDAKNAFNWATVFICVCIVFNHVKRIIAKIADFSRSSMHIGELWILKSGRK